MKNFLRTRLKLIAIILALVIILMISAGCQIDDRESSSAPQNNQTGESPQELPIESEINTESDTTDQNDQPVSDPSDPEVIMSQWSASAHANSFVNDLDGKNNSCARCHAPIEWKPTIADLPESCFSCKFELSEPPAYIAESEWQSIPCKVCHQVDKKGNVEPEISWLEVAALDEYATVENSTELCLKCHAPVNVREHAAIEVGGAHQGYLCSDCHSAHDLTTSCSESDCHASLQDTENANIPGHDENHSSIACEACHDGSGLNVGPDEATEVWITFADWTVELEDSSESGYVPFTSHHIVLEADCERCHFSENPWDLPVDIEIP